MTRISTLLAALALAWTPGALEAQADRPARPADVATPEAIVTAAYDALSRRPGESSDWPRMLSLFLSEARLIPNTEQTNGEFRVLSPVEFRDWAEAWFAENAPIGGPDDAGFVEEQVHSVVERYGDVAHVMSTYRARFWDSDEVLGRGINSFQLVRHDGRWWIAGIAWDNEAGAGPIPAEYLPR